MTSINPSSAPVRFLFEDTQETPARFFEDFKKHCNWKPRDNKRFENPEAYLKAANYVMENKLKSEVEIFFISLKSYADRSKGMTENKLTINDFKKITLKLVENDLIPLQKALEALRDLSPTSFSLETSSTPITTVHPSLLGITSLATKTLTATFPTNSQTGQVETSKTVTSTKPEPLSTEDKRNEIIQKIRNNQAHKECIQDLVLLYAHSPQNRLPYLKEFEPHGAYNGVGNPYSNCSYQGRYKYSINKEEFDALLESTRSDKYVIATDLVRFIKDGKPFAIQLVKQLLKEKSLHTLDKVYYLLLSNPLKNTNTEEMSSLILDYFNILLEDYDSSRDQKKLFNICFKYYETSNAFSSCKALKCPLIDIANRILAAGSHHQTFSVLGLKMYLDVVEKKKNEWSKKFESKD